MEERDDEGVITLDGVHSDDEDESPIRRKCVYGVKCKNTKCRFMHPESRSLAGTSRKTAQDGGMFDFEQIERLEGAAVAVIGRLVKWPELHRFR